ncbi:zinc finger HIT domain-containing protein 3 isoform X2 [Varanus komodoensis]|uniref:Zinc finger HIT domain-containing protein 3 n=1 Tax=Varanus komodoensis TaxID=61221 RepID=A0A8D2LV53_VARKO|nr:zinc finger HIT domain-containing protein 3 isoform X2 [Varanus komodoensis]
MPKASEPCVVCGEGGPGAAKYRCPGCRLRYCSLPCYKKHKEQCQGQIYHGAQPAKPEISWDAQEERSVNAEGSTWSVDNILTDDDEDDKVPLEKLQLLSKSEELRGILLNPHLRQLLVDVDRAEDKSFALRKSMQEPLFVEFADCCLRTVEPPEKENERPA